MRVCVFEDAGVASLEPLTLTRPAFELRCGRFSLLHRQMLHFPTSEVGVLTRPLLIGVTRVLHPDIQVNDSTWLDAGPVILINARWLPPVAAEQDPSRPHVGLVAGQVAYVVLPPGETPSRFLVTPDEALETWCKTLPVLPAGGVMIQYPWDLVEQNSTMLQRDFANRSSKQDGTPRPLGVMVIGPADQLVVDPAAKIDPLVLADTTKGPIIIDGDAEVQAFSRLEGPCYIGPGTWILGAKVRGSSIGPTCRIGGEVEASIIHGCSNKAHDGFLGHSYLGEWINIGAGTQFSDLRNDYGTVKLTINGIRTDSGLPKVGAFVGDHSKIAIGAYLNTGTVIGAFCNVLPNGSLLPRVVPSFCTVWLTHLREAKNLERLMTTASLMMKRRNCQMTEAHAALYWGLFRETYGQRDSLLHPTKPWQAREGA